MLSRFMALGESLRARMLAFFLFVSIVSIIFLSTSFYLLSAGIIRKNSNRLLEDLIGQVTIETDNLFDDARRTLRMVANDPKIQQVLRQPLPESVSARYSVELEVDTQLSFIQSYVRNLFGIYIIGANGTSYKSNFFSGKEERWQDAPWYQRILWAADTVWLGPHNGAFMVETLGQPIVTCGESIIDKASGRSLGVILVDIEVATIEGMLKADPGGRGYVGLIDGEGRIVCGIQGFPSRDEAAAVLSSLSPGSSPGRSDYLLYSKPLQVNDWKTVGVIPKRELTSGMGSVAKLIVVLFAAVCLLDLLAALWFTARLTNPIEKLMALMKRVETGDFNVNMDVHARDEIGKLSESFNLMVRRLDSSRQELYLNQQNLRKAELRTLQAQINPHFLYNTLDSICWLARADRRGEIIGTITALTRLLRIGLSKGGEVIPIRDEIEHVTNYLIIQKVRYGRIFDYEVDIPEELKGYRTMKLILQPLVENALYHGIKASGQRGSIGISAVREDGHILFRVSDTGAGMDSERLEKVVRSLHEPDGSRAEGFGLKNVNDRLRIFFGEECRLDLASGVGRGTVVSFRIPLLEGE